MPLAQVFARGSHSASSHEKHIVSLRDSLEMSQECFTAIQFVRFYDCHNCVHLDPRFVIPPGGFEQNACQRLGFGENDSTDFPRNLAGVFFQYLVNTEPQLDCVGPW